MTLWLGANQGNLPHTGKFRGHNHSGSKVIMILVCYVN